MNDYACEPKWLTGLSFEEVGAIKGKWAILTKELVYIASCCKKFIVPRGFRTDFASIPRLLWTLVDSPVSGLFRRASVLHDWLYSQAGKLPDGFTYSRKDADLWFKEAMILSGVSPVKVWVIWSGVRSGGWWTWNQYTKNPLVVPSVDSP